MPLTNSCETKCYLNIFFYLVAIRLWTAPQSNKVKSLNMPKKHVLHTSGHFVYEICMITFRNISYITLLFFLVHIHTHRQLAAFPAVELMLHNNFSISSLASCIHMYVSRCAKKFSNQITMIYPLLGIVALSARSSPSLQVTMNGA